jgi:hypothetical protein
LAASAVDSRVRSTCGDCRQCPLTAGVRRRRPFVVDLGPVALEHIANPPLMFKPSLLARACKDWLDPILLEAEQCN